VVSVRLRSAKAVLQSGGYVCEQPSEKKKLSLTRMGGGSVMASLAKDYAFLLQHFADVLAILPLMGFTGRGAAHASARTTVTVSFNTIVIHQLALLIDDTSHSLPR
jgi:hypothetical protein